VYQHQQHLVPVGMMIVYDLLIQRPLVIAMHEHIRPLLLIRVLMLLFSLHPMSLQAHNYIINQKQKDIVLVDDGMMDGDIFVCI
jgi:hypothetical protein